MSREDFRHSNPLRTVCEVTREIRDIIEAARDQIGETVYAEIGSRLLEQMRMQKKMDAKLRQYKFNWDEDMWRPNKDHLSDQERRSHANL